MSECQNAVHRSMKAAALLIHAAAQSDDIITALRLVLGPIVSALEIQASLSKPASIITPRSAGRSFWPRQQCVLWWHWCCWQALTWRVEDQGACWRGYRPHCLPLRCPGEHCRSCMREPHSCKISLDCVGKIALQGHIKDGYQLNSC